MNVRGMRRRGSGFRRLVAALMGTRARGEQVGEQYRGIGT